jgi:hypothetical protein
MLVLVAVGSSVWLGVVVAVGTSVWECGLVWVGKVGFWTVGLASGSCVGEVPQEVNISMTMTKKLNISFLRMFSFLFKMNDIPCMVLA